MHYLKPTKKQLVHHLMPQNKKELAILELLTSHFWQSKYSQNVKKKLQILDTIITIIIIINTTTTAKY
jgi:hypothetical protein